MKRFYLLLTLLLSLCIPQVNAQGEYDEATMGKIVVQLNTATWAQSTPFNNLCFTTDGAQASTGCVPTAYAIIAHYHQWPQSATETKVYHSGTGESITLGHAYDYANMLSSYSGTYTDTQASAVATLMRDLGYAYEVDYGAGNTQSGSGGEGPTKFMNVFRYSCNTPCNHGAYATVRETLANDETWVQYIKQSLDAGLPIPYSSIVKNPTTGESRGRHIFILDGYTDNGYYHFNWGWGGNANGWYTLDAMKTDATSDYSTNHYAYFMLTPNKTKYTVTATSSPDGAGNVSINGGTVGSTASAELMEGLTATLVAEANTGYSFSHWSKGTETYSTSKSCTAKVASSDNDYVANFLTIGNTTVDVTVNIPNSSYGTVTYNNGTVASGTTLKPNQNAEVTLTATANSGYIFSGWTVTKGTESEKNYTGTELTLVATGETTVTANFAQSVADYSMKYADGGLVLSGSNSGVTLNSTLTFTPTKEKPAALQLKSTSGTTEVFGITTSSRLRAYALEADGTTGHSTVTYTLSVPEDYLITAYNLKYYVSSTYTGLVTVSNGTITETPTDTEDHYLTYSANVARSASSGVKSTSFTLSSSNTGANINILSFDVTVMKEGSDAGSGETPVTTYTVTATADPATAGSVTGGGTYEENATVTLAASANSGYEFVNWTKGTNVVSENATFEFTANATNAGDYVANFDVVQQGGETVDLSGKWFRVKSGDICLNIENNTAHTAGTKGGVNVIASELNSDAQIFYFEKSGSGYKLKSKGGYYIKCQQWNVDATSKESTNGTELIFESTGNELEYLIKWENPNDNDYFMHGQANQDTSGINYAYCNATEAQAAIWTLEEVTLCTVTATAGNGGSVTPETTTVESGTSVSFTATANTGYKFKNWTNGAGTEVSTDAEYTFTATEATELTANFKETLTVAVTLTDAQANTFNVQLNDLLDVEIATIEAKLLEAYPFIKLGETGSYAATSGTYTNAVTLPFQVSNGKAEGNEYWYNIYWLSNADTYPVYMSATNSTDQYVSKVTEAQPYGSSMYNTLDYDRNISWAVYSVDNSFNFIFKNKLTNQYIKVTSVVATGDAQNASYVGEAEATAFNLLKNTGTYNGDYALVADVDGTTGYLCSTSDNYGYATHSADNNRNGAWVKFAEDPGYISMIYDLYWGIYINFGADSDYMMPADIQEIQTDLLENTDFENQTGSVKLSTINEYKIIVNEAIASKGNWLDLTLTVAPENSGTVAINGETTGSKKVPANYEVPIAATPATGYEFVNWTKDGEFSTNAETTCTITEATNLVANFKLKEYTITVSTSDTNGMAYIGDNATTTTTTVEHGNEVTLTAVANDGYEFEGWYLNDNKVADATAEYTFAPEANGEYVAKFTKQATVYYTVTIESDFYGAAIINTGISTQITTTASYAEGSSVTLTAVSDYQENGQMFIGWYDGETLVSEEYNFEFTLTGNVTYQAKFEEGYRVSVKQTLSMVTLTDTKGRQGTGVLLVKKGDTVTFSAMAAYDGYKVTWYDTEGNVISEKQEFEQTVDSNLVYTAVAEPVYYTLTVSTEGTNGSVKASSGTNEGTEIEVGYNCEAVITAEPASGYRFVEWQTAEGDVVSKKKSYTIPAITDVNAMVDVEYVAYFEEGEEEETGVYYRIAYDFPESNAVATVATQEETLTISYANGSFKAGEENGPTSIWTSSSNSPTLTLTATYNRTEYKNINKVSDTYSPLNLSLNSRPYGKGSDYNETKYTIAIDSVYNADYKITAYSILYTPYKNGAITNAVNNQLAVTGLNNYSVSFYVTGTAQDSSVDIQEFSVTVQSEGVAEPTTVRYYVQSEACGNAVSTKPNALKMTQDTVASSIFYYAGNKLLSYSTGKYVKEDGTTCGLQAYGANNAGEVTITTVEGVSTIAAPNYMHANTNVGTEGTTYFVDHCSENLAAHADGHNFVVEQVKYLPVTITSAGFATFYAPVAVELPDGITAHTIRISGDYAILNEPLKTIPAGTAVILAATQGDYKLAIKAEDDTYVESIMKGSVAAEFIDEDAFVLYQKNGVVGMYLAEMNQEGNTSFLNNSHKAYLPKSAVPSNVSMSAGFRFVFGTTAIEEVEGENGDVKTIYDLQGRKLNDITVPGIYIVNGKKIIVK